MREVTDPNILAQLNASTGMEVTDPAILAQLNGEQIPNGESIFPQEQPATNMPEPQEGLGRTALEKGLQGATFGFADEITNRLGAGIASMLTDEDYNTLLQEAQDMAKARGQRQSEQRPVTSVLSEIGGSMGTGIATGATKAGGALIKGIASGGLPARIAKGAAAGAVSGGLYGAGTAEEGQRLEGAKEAAMTGAAFGGVLPAAGEAVRGVVLPKVSEALRPLAQRAKEFDIPLSIDQVAPTRFRKTVKKISQNLPGSGVGDFEDLQRTKWNQAVARTIGQQELAPSSINDFIAKNSADYDSVLKGKTVIIGKDIFKDLDNIKLKKTAEAKGVINDYIDELKANLDKGKISGETLNSLRSNFLKDLPSKQGDAKVGLSEILSKVNNIIYKNVSKVDKKILDNANREYRNFKTIEPLLEGSATGEINPTQLLSRVKANKYIKASRKETGKDELVDLARIGKELLPKSGGSDTYEKLAITGGLTGGAAGVAYLEPLTLALTAGTLTANRLMQELNKLSPRVAKAVEKGGVRFIPKSLVPALLSGLGGSNMTSSRENQVGEL